MTKQFPMMNVTVLKQYVNKHTRGSVERACVRVT